MHDFWGEPPDGWVSDGRNVAGAIGSLYGLD